MKYYILGHLLKSSKDEGDKQSYDTINFFLRQANYHGALGIAIRLFGNYNKYELEEKFGEDAVYAPADLKPETSSNTKDWNSFIDKSGKLMLLFSPSQEEIYFLQGA